MSEQILDYMTHNTFAGLVIVSCIAALVAGVISLLLENKD